MWPSADLQSVILAVEQRKAVNLHGLGQREQLLQLQICSFH
jgi:hypothetical protein